MLGAAAALRVLSLGGGLGRSVSGDASGRDRYAPCDIRSDFGAFAETFAGLADPEIIGGAWS